MHAPEIENPMLAGLPLVPLHVTTEASMAVIRNVDSITSSPLTLEMFITVAVAVIFHTCQPADILVLEICIKCA